MSDNFIRMRVCATCNVEMLANEDNFYRTSGNKLQKSCKSCVIKRSRDNKQTESGMQSRRKYNRSAALKRRYGITVEEYDAMYEEQHGVCLVCSKPSTKLDGYGNIARLHVDHNHDTGEVRGLLCNNCNTALGLLKESPEIIRRLGDYINGN